MSKTSCFNKTVFQKNLTRFSPFWILYAILMLALVPIRAMQGSSIGHYISGRFLFSVDFPLVYLLYGTAAAVLLFSYLFRGVSANMYHSFPVGRRAYFFTNVLSGILFFLVPHFLAALVSLIATDLDAVMVGAWFLYACLSTFFAFAVAVLAIVCAGNVLGAGILGLMLHFGPLVLEASRFALTPMLYGFRNDRPSIAEKLSPTTWLITGRALSFRSEYADVAGASPLEKLELSWPHLVLIAGLGLALLVLSYYLYKVRPLEAAGDLIAFPRLRTPFQICFSLCGAILLGNAALSLLFLDAIDRQWLRTPIPVLFCYLSALCLCYFAAEMMLRKSLRVFQPAKLLKCGATALAVALCILAVHLDAAKITWRLPQLSEIQSVQLGGYGPQLTDEASIREIRDLHRIFLENRDEIQDRIDGRYRYFDGDTPRDQSTATITYRLKDGRSLTRSYDLFTAADLPDIENLSVRLNALLNRKDFIQYRLFQGSWLLKEAGGADPFDVLAQEADSGMLWLGNLNPQALPQRDLLPLIEAMKLDLEDGHLGQTTQFVPDSETASLGSICFYYPDPTAYNTYLAYAPDTIADHYTSGIDIPFTAQCENLLAALEELGYSDGNFEFSPGTFGID